MGSLRPHCILYRVSFPLMHNGNNGLHKIPYSMGFSEGVFACLLIRLFAGLMCSAVKVAMVTMLGDVSESINRKVRNYSRVPLLASGGVIGPLLQAALAHRYGGSGFWKRFPVLNSQLACAGLVAAVAIVNAVYLREVRKSTPQGKINEANGS